jgi:hypothetical protein
VRVDFIDAAVVYCSVIILNLEPCMLNTCVLEPLLLIKAWETLLVKKKICIQLQILADRRGHIYSRVYTHLHISNSLKLTNGLR